jgi:ABC-type phosphate transport system substrate-binding protein
MKKLVTILLLACGVASAADLTGAGATFPYPIYAKWAEAYKAATGIGQLSIHRFRWWYPSNQSKDS